MARTGRMAYQAHDEYEFDVFWSHSGVEKRLVVELNRQLDELRHSRVSFNNFLDIQHNSLPPGQQFPDNIGRAIRSCRIAVAFVSKSFLKRYWPMCELADLVDTHKPILPVFYGVDPRELLHNMDARVAGWKSSLPNLPDATIERWIGALRTIRSMCGYVIPMDTVDANSPKVQRLLSDIRLLLAASVLNEGTTNDATIKLACKDINGELAHQEYDNHTTESMRESAEYLMRWGAIPNLVELLKTLYETEHWAMAEAVWALGNILDKARNGKAKAEAVKAGAVEILADILMLEDGEKPAAYCLRNILGSEISGLACQKLKDRNEMRGGAIRAKLNEMIRRPGAHKGCIETCVAVLRRLDACKYKG